MSGFMRVKQTVMVIVLVVFVVMSLWGDVLFQEGNPLPVIGAIIRLEFSTWPIVPVGGTEARFIRFSGADENAVSWNLVADGWTFREQLGNTMFYDKDGTELMVTIRMFTRRHQILEMPLR